MRAATGLAVLLAIAQAGCGEIREVEVDRSGGATDGAGETDETGTPMGTAGSPDSGGSSGSDHDTDPIPETSGGDGTEVPRTAFCSSTMAEMTADSLSIDVEVSGVDTADDPWVGIRGSRTDDFPLHVTVEKVGFETAELVDIDACASAYDLMFADAGQAIEDACRPGNVDESDPTVSTDPLAPLTDGGADGTWRITVTLREDSTLELYAACVSFTQPEG